MGNKVLKIRKPITKLIEFTVRCLLVAAISAQLVIAPLSVQIAGANEPSHALPLKRRGILEPRTRGPLPDHSSSTGVQLASRGAEAASNTGAQMRFSNPPSDQEILACGILPQPLAPVGRTNGRENRDLVRLLLQYQQSIRLGGAPDALDPLSEFLQRHPASA